MPNELKFIDEIDLDTGWEIETDTGFKPISKIYKTIEYEKYILKTENELLECADLHKVFTDNYEEVFVKDLSVGDKVITKNGIETVLSVENTHIKENMYDITVDDENHRFYSNGILSHNTTTMVCYFLWYVLFTQDKACAVLANKGATARQIVGRIELAYMNLPKWLQAGITVWNKGSFCLENGSSIMSASTSSDSVRGSSFSCVSEDTKVTIVDDKNGVWYTPINMVEHISNGENNSMHKERKYYYVYRITNLVNNKEYIGFHSTDNLNDGYMGSGKLLIHAIEKYGIENFHKDILKMFDNREDAEACERELVNEEYVNRKDTYNISIGGNVCILYGENNGFYGKKHTPETIAKIVKANKEKEAKGEIHHPKTLKTAPMRIGNHIFDSYRQASIMLGGLSKLEILCYLYHNKNCYLLNETEQENVCKEFKKYLIDKEERKRKHAENVSKSWTIERREKYSKMFSGRKNPWNEKTNKNPEKIAKTAAKHRGMKRSPETCRKISEAVKRRFNKHKEENSNESINK